MSEKNSSRHGSNHGKLRSSFHSIPIATAATPRRQFKGCLYWYPYEA